jgi:hypothetical protein
MFELRLERDVHDIEKPKKEKEKKMMSLLQNVKAWFTLDRRKRTGVVRCRYGVNKLMICFIKENEYNIRGSIKSSVPLSAAVSCTVQDVATSSSKIWVDLCVQLEN